MLSVRAQIAAAQLAFFGLAVPPLLYVLSRHGKHGLPGWFFLFAFCALRIVGGAMVVNAEAHDTYSIDGAIISQIGLSPLCFALSGIAHEASQTVVQRHGFVLGWPFQIVSHLMVLTALPLVIVGALNVTSPGQTLDQINQAVNLVRAGASIFLVVSALIVGQIVISLLQRRSLAAEKRLIIGVAVCVPEFILRVLYLFLGAVINSSSWSVLTGGSLAEQVVLEVLPEFLILIVLVAVGFSTRSLPQDREAAGHPAAPVSERY